MSIEYKFFATDMDGTLLNNKKEISTANLKAMQDLFNKNIEIAICTGRPYSTVKPYLDLLGFPCWLISNNGSVIRNKDRKVISTTYIQKAALQKAINILEEENMYFHASDEEYTYINSIWNRIVKIHEYMSRVEKSKIKSILNPIYTVLLSNTHKKVNFNSFIQNNGNISSIFIANRDKKKLDRVKEKLSHIKGIDISSSGKYNIEILDAEATKAHGIMKLLAELNIESNEIVAVGDNLNDLTMIRYAGLGVAMGNSENVIKENAVCTTKTNEENGIAHLIYEKIICEKQTIKKT